MTESCIQMLSHIYNSQKTSMEPVKIELESKSPIYDAQYLTENGYITQPMTGAKALFLSLTEKGRQFVENGYTLPAPPQFSSKFNFQGPTTFTNSFINEAPMSNMVLGTISESPISFNAESSLSELESLIRSKPSEDQAILNEMLEILREIHGSEKPVDKGRLSRFYEVIKKSSDLILPIGKFFFDIFFRLGA